MVARPIWRGQIRLALVSIPVEIYSATKSGAQIQFHQVHEPSGKRIKYEKVVPGIGPVDKDEIAGIIDRWIAEDHPISHRWVDAAELEARPELVRTMSVRPPTSAGRVRLVEIADVDLQACGGTHVRSTGEIGPVSVGKIENKCKMNRRIQSQ